MSGNDIGQEIKVAAAGRQWNLHQPANLEALWDAMGQEDDFGDERIPYWTELWPASVALANFLFSRKQELQGRKCLDLGCGLGLTGMAAAWLGALAMAIDYEPAALAAAKVNAKANDIDKIAWVLMDWRKPALRHKSLHYIWGADIIYEKRSMRPVLELLKHGLTPHGSAWIAEPGRTIFEGFIELSRGSGWLCEPVYNERINAILPQTGSQNVTIWQMRKERR